MFDSMPPAFDENVSVASLPAAVIAILASMKPFWAALGSTSRHPVGIEKRIPSNRRSNGPGREDDPEPPSDFAAGGSFFATRIGGSSVGGSSRQPAEASANSAAPIKPRTGLR